MDLQSIHHNCSPRLRWGLAEQMKKQGQQADGSEQSAMMDMMADSQTVDIVPLIPAVPTPPWRQPRGKYMVS